WPRPKRRPTLSRRAARHPSTLHRRDLAQIRPSYLRSTGDDSGGTCPPSCKHRGQDPCDKGRCVEKDRAIGQHAQGTLVGTEVGEVWHTNAHTPGAQTGGRGASPPT